MGDGRLLRRLNMPYTLRNYAGVIVRDLPLYLVKLGGGRRAYVGIRNRRERLIPAPDASGYRCDWQWTSELHAPKLLPFLGRWLMRRALADHPIRRASRPERIPERPKAAFVIGHRGLERLPNLLATLESIAGQRGVDCECLVVEQDGEARIRDRLPAWVRYLHTPTPAGMPYNRSWAFNVGASHTRAPVLILHDNDMLVPADYAAEILRRIAQGYEVVNPKRFVFYLSEAHTREVHAAQAALDARPPEAIMQNAEGGGSVAITREAFEAIGGMDESFLGWGGEDNEFWERAQTCRVWPFGYLPIVHLWHPAQPAKQQDWNSTLLRHRRLSHIAPEVRAIRLRALTKGQLHGPTPIDPYE